MKTEEEIRKAYETTNKLFQELQLVFSNKPNDVICGFLYGLKWVLGEEEESEG